jgi:hypothetical protein
MAAGAKYVIRVRGLAMKVTTDDVGDFIYVTIYINWKDDKF